MLDEALPTWTSVTTLLSSVKDWPNIVKSLQNHVLGCRASVRNLVCSMRKHHGCDVAYAHDLTAGEEIDTNSPIAFEQ